VRKVLIAAHETGAIGRIEFVRVVVSATTVNQTMLAITPLGQVPTLVLDDGRALYDSAVICRFLDRVLGNGALIPTEPLAEIETMRRYALGDGLTVLLMNLIAERLRRQPGQSDRRIEVVEHKLSRVFAALEREAGAPASGSFDLGHIAVVAALSYLDFRLPQESGWRARHPALARWLEDVCTRPSVSATAYFDDLAVPAQPQTAG
jgi:glutathione S-transferase